MLLLYCYLFTAGACLGSAITCFADRTCAQLPLLSLARSRCPQCAHQLRPWQLIPIIGILLQRGRCFDCHHPINRCSTYVELLCGTLLLTSYPQDWDNLPLLLGYGVLLFNSLTDRQTLAVYPATLVLPAVLGLFRQPPELTLDTGILVALLLGLGLLAHYTDQFGLGDVEVLAMLACLVTPATVITSLTLATLGALLTFLLRPTTRLPFVPFISWGVLLTTHWPWSGPLSWA